MDNRSLKIVLAWIVLIVIGIPLIISLSGIGLFGILSIAVIAMAARVLYNNKD
tara:strand:+ start:2525 stop:2683 length:159 start_codon:yes stop_codon:yes gene_type:complete